MITKEEVINTAEGLANYKAHSFTPYGDRTDLLTVVFTDKSVRKFLLFGKCLWANGGVGVDSYEDWEEVENL
jgi:hypothetical protein